MKRLLVLLCVLLCTATVFSQTTPNLSLNIPGTGAVGWGGLLNSNEEILDTFLGGLTKCTTDGALATWSQSTGLWTCPAGSGIPAFAPYGVLTAGASVPTWVAPTANAQCYMSAASNYATTPPSFQTCPSGSGTFPSTIAAVAHKWINSYTSSTGLFTETQPASTDLSDVSSLETLSAAQAAFSGHGSCTNQVVTAANANGAPTCSTVVPGMMGTLVAGSNGLAASATSPTGATGLNGAVAPNSKAFVGTSSTGQVIDATSTLFLAAMMPALTGDVTTPGAGLATTLATVNSSPGSCGDASHVCQITTIGKGLVTVQTPVSISVSASASLSGLTQATASPTALSNGAYAQIWDWALTGSVTAFTFGETAAATGTGNSILGLTTLSGSTATPLNIIQGAATSATTPAPAINVSATWNNGIANNLIQLSVVNTNSTNSADCVIDVLGGTSGTTQESCLGVTGYIDLAGGVQGTTAATNVTIAGGFGASSASSQLGGVIAQGSDNSSNSASAKAGFAIVRCGGLTNATPNAAALEGPCQVVQPYLAGATTAAGLAMCGTTTQYKVSACGTGPAVNFIGISTGTQNGSVYVVTSGQAVMTLSSSLTAIGDTVCLSTGTAGDGTDSGGQAVCPTAGAQVGVIVADAGTLTANSGNGTGTYTLSTTSVVVELHPR